MLFKKLKEITLKIIKALLYFLVGSDNWREPIFWIIFFNDNSRIMNIHYVSRGALQTFMKRTPTFTTTICRSHSVVPCEIRTQNTWAVENGVTTAYTTRPTVQSIITELVRLLDQKPCYLDTQRPVTYVIMILVVWMFISKQQ